MMIINRQSLLAIVLAGLVTVPANASDRSAWRLFPAANTEADKPDVELVGYKKKAPPLPSSTQRKTQDGRELCSPVTGCRPALHQHGSGVFAEALFLRPGNVDVVYATEQSSTDPTLASPTGPVGRTNIDHGSGFRIGAGWALQGDASVVGTYTWLASDTEDTITAVPGNVLNLDIGHPSVETSGDASLGAAARYDLDFQLADLDYRALLGGNRDAALNYTVGLRYAHLAQDFSASQEIFAGDGLTTASSGIDFDGFGIRFGLDGMKRRAGTGLLLYANGHANFVAGEFKANFTQSNQFGGTAVIRNEFEDYRIVTILDTELGIGWENATGRFRVTSGYLISGWFNTLSTSSYLSGVQAGSYGDLSETLTFDGLVSRIEWRY